MKRTVLTISLLGTVFVLISIFSNIELYADAAPVQSYSGNVVSYDSKGIVLEKEDLVLDIQDLERCTTTIEGQYNCSGLYNIEAIFYFQNPNEDIEIDIFFPFPSVSLAEEVEMTFNDQSITNIEQKDFTYRTRGLYSSHSERSAFTKLNFKKGSNKLIVRYKQILNPILSLTNRQVYRNLQYVLSSGSLWEGPIGELNITIKFNSPVSYQRYYFSNSGYFFEQTSENELKYKAINTEPQVELNLNFIPSYLWTRLLPYVKGEEYKLSFEDRQKFEKDFRELFKIAKSGSPDPQVNGEGVVFDIFARNAVTLVEDGQATKETQQWYVKYRLASIGLGIEIDDRLIQTCNAQQFPYYDFDTHKKVVLNDIQAYVSPEITTPYIDELKAFQNHCEFATNNSNPNNQTNIEQTKTPDSNVNNWIILFATISVGVNLLLLRKTILKYVTNFSNKVRDSLKNRKV